MEKIWEESRTEGIERTIENHCTKKGMGRGRSL